MSDIPTSGYKYIPRMMLSAPAGQYTRPCFQPALVDNKPATNRTVRDTEDEYICKIEVKGFLRKKGFAFTLCGALVTVRGFRKPPRGQGSQPCKILFTIPPQINNQFYVVKKAIKFVDDFIEFSFTRSEILPSRERTRYECYTCGEPWASGDDHIANGKRPGNGIAGPEN